MLNLIQSKDDLIDFSKLELGTISFEINISGSSCVSYTFLDKFFDGFKIGSKVDVSKNELIVWLFEPFSFINGRTLLSL